MDYYFLYGVLIIKQEINYCFYKWFIIYKLMGMGAGSIKFAFAIVNLEVIDYKITRLD